jgi:ABC-type sugar transport system substrate-binding protein
MKRMIIAAAATLLAASTSYAGTIGISIASNDTWLAVMVDAMKTEAAKTSQPLQIEFADQDVTKQISQVQNFIADKADAIIVNVVDSTASPEITKMAAEAGIPLIYVNNTPSDLDKLGPKAAFIGSQESEAGTLETQEVCRILKEQGKTDDAGILIIQGVLAPHAAQARSKAVHDVVATEDCKFLKIIDEQTASWDPVKAQDLMTNWITAGYKPAAVIANNDEMAIGAINSLKAAGYSIARAGAAAHCHPLAGRWYGEGHPESATGGIARPQRTRRRTSFRPQFRFGPTLHVRMATSAGSLALGGFHRDAERAWRCRHAGQRLRLRSPAGGTCRAHQHCLRRLAG